MKYSQEELNNRFKKAKERISELKERLAEIIQSEAKTEKD